MDTEEKDFNEVRSLLKDMNGNSLREGDLVMVILAKPVLVGFIKQLAEPSVLTKEKRPGIMTVTGSIQLAYVPGVPFSFGEVAKLVNPVATKFVEELAASLKHPADIQLPKREKGPEVVKTPDPSPVEDVRDPIPEGKPPAV